MGATAAPTPLRQRTRWTVAAMSGEANDTLEIAISEEYETWRQEQGEEN